MLIKSQRPSLFEEMVKIIHENDFPYTIKKYEKNQLICEAQSKCDKIGIVIDGEISIENILFNGKKNIINIINDCFGEILLFTEENLYPYNVVSYKNCEIIFITKEILFKIFKVDMIILEKFLQHISQSYMILNQYIKLKSQKTINSKLAYYLIHYVKISPEYTKYKITTKTELAEFLGVERQSLIRELNKLKEKLVIDYNKQYIMIINYDYIISLID
jgi:CRP-like cAMP-binding protein